MIVADTTYTITASKITVKSNDVAALTKGYTCIPEMKGGKTYSITDISCDAGSIIKIDLFASHRLILKDTTESRFVFADKQMKIYNSYFSGNYTKTSTWGSIWWIILIIVVAVIVVVAIVAALIATLCKPKNLKKVTK